jgi:hypothetical protein
LFTEAHKCGQNCLAGGARLWTFASRMQTGPDATKTRDYIEFADRDTAASARRGFRERGHAIQHCVFERPEQALVAGTAPS